MGTLIFQPTFFFSKTRLSKLSLISIDPGLNLNKTYRVKSRFSTNRAKTSTQTEEETSTSTTTQGDLADVVLKVHRMTKMIFHFQL